MKPKFYLLILLIVNSQLITLPSDGQILNSQTVCPIKDDVGFCCNAGEMDNLNSFISKGNGSKSNQESKNLIAAISVFQYYNRDVKITSMRKPCVSGSYIGPDIKTTLIP